MKKYLLALGMILSACGQENEIKISEEKSIDLGSHQSNPASQSVQCEDACPFAHDDMCDDGGPNSLYSLCPLGTDCGDCGPRPEGMCRVDDDCEDGLCIFPQVICEEGAVCEGPEFGLCVEILSCPEDVFVCPDGTEIGRTGPDCEFNCYGLILPLGRCRVDADCYEGSCIYDTEHPDETGLGRCMDAGACDDSCTWANDGVCDDGGTHSEYDVCDFGSDCSDCGIRF